MDQRDSRLGIPPQISECMECSISQKHFSVVQIGVHVDLGEVRMGLNETVKSGRILAQKARHGLERSLLSHRE